MDTIAGQRDAKLHRHPYAVGHQYAVPTARRFFHGAGQADPLLRGVRSGSTRPVSAAKMASLRAENLFAGLPACRKATMMRVGFGPRDAPKRTRPVEIEAT